ncbi:hypothetical protein PENTCL1PPCAC_11894, partial [Pristionchus entomophagus]
FFLIARIIEIILSTTAILPLPLLVAAIHRARVVHPLLRLFLIIFVLSLGASAIANIAAAAISEIRDSPERLRSITVKLSTKTIGSICQLLACNFTILAWLALTFCSFERVASTRIPDRYDRRFRSRDSTALNLCAFIPIAVVCILLQYVKTTDIIFVAEFTVLFTLNLLIHQAFLRLNKHILCWGAAALLILIWSTIVMRTSTESPRYEAIYFTLQAALTLLAVYLLLTEPMLQPALKSFVISQWPLRTSSGCLP